MIYRNLGKSKFEESWRTKGPLQPARGITAADFDEDGDLDIYVSNYRLQPNLLWQNDGKGGLANVATPFGTAGDGGLGAWGIRSALPGAILTTMGISISLSGTSAIRPPTRIVLSSCATRGLRGSFISRIRAAGRGCAGRNPTPHQPWLILTTMGCWTCSSPLSTEEIGASSIVIRGIGSSRRFPMPQA